MLRFLIPIAALLLSDALLLVGHGIQLTLLPIRAEIEQFTATQIALTSSTYFTGFVVGCLLAPSIIRRVGHIRSFAVLAAGFASFTLLFHGFPVFEAWLGLRFMVGTCISGLYMIIESWLNETSSQESRGTVLSVYMVINMLMIMVGQQLLNLAEPGAETLFGLAAIFLCLAIIPVSLTLSLTPAPLRSVKINVPRVWELSHIGVAGAVASGLATGAFWGLGPLFARQAGMETRELTLFMSAAVAGGAIFQLPLGRLSDKLDRRLVVLSAALVGAAVSVLISLFYTNTTLLVGLAVLWGGMIMTMYAICLAHATDNAEADEFVMVGSCILLLFGMSSALGAPLASQFMELGGPRGLYTFSALCMVVLAGMIVVRRRRHYLPVVDETEAFRTFVDTTPVAFALDPRTEDHDTEAPVDGETGDGDPHGGENAENERAR